MDISGTKISLVQGDITEQETEAIVNAANGSLMGGGGVDGAIHRRGGPRILEECRTLRSTRWPHGLPPGGAAITTGGNLKAAYVIHTVGPVWRGGTQGEDRLLASCYRNTLSLSRTHGIRTISFPSISTGAYGYPLRQACHVALRSVREWLERTGGLDGIAFVLFTPSDFAVYRDAMSSA